MTSKSFFLAAIAPCFLVAGLADAATVGGMDAGAWSRSVKFEVASPLVAKLFPKPLESRVCINADVAKQGPIAIALVEDGPDCQLVSSKIAHGSFTATRTCRAERGQIETFNLTGRFTPDAIDLDSTTHTARGTPVATHTRFRRVGACQADTPLPSQ